MLIAPELGDISSGSFERSADAIRIGEQAARAMAAQLQRYVFRSKLKLLPLDLQVIGGFLPPPSARGPALAVSAAGDVELDMGAAGGPRSLQIRQAAATDGKVPQRLPSPKFEEPSWRIVPVKI